MLATGGIADDLAILHDNAVEMVTAAKSHPKLGSGVDRIEKAFHPNRLVSRNGTGAVQRPDFGNKGAIVLRISQRILYGRQRRHFRSLTCWKSFQNTSVLVSNR